MPVLKMQYIIFCFIIRYCYLNVKRFSFQLHKSIENIMFRTINFNKVLTKVCENDVLKI